jgi:hypothetical protein
MKTLFEIVIFNTRQNNVYYLGILFMTFGMILISTSKNVESNENDERESYLEKNKID